MCNPPSPLTGINKYKDFTGMYWGTPCMSRNVFHVGCVTRVMQNKKNARSTVSFCFRVKANNANLKVDLYFNNDPIDSSEDRKLLSQIGIQDKMVSCHCNITLSRAIEK